MGTRLIRGREFSERDNHAAAPVALISETLVHRYWPHSNPLGGHLTVLAHVYSGETTAPRPLEIIGVVKDVRNLQPLETRAHGLRSLRTEPGFVGIFSNPDWRVSHECGGTSARGRTVSR